MLSEIADVYSTVFAPELFLLVCTLGIILYEWHYSTTTDSLLSLGGRVTTLGGAWVLAFLITELPETAITASAYWVDDVFASVGILAGFLVLAVAWTVTDWGRYLPEFALFVIVLTVGHAVIVPFWDVSSHVTYTTAPVSYFIALNRRLVPTALIPGGMVVTRPLTGAHSVLQSVGGVVLALVFVAGFLWVRRQHAERPIEAQNTAD